MSSISCLQDMFATLSPIEQRIATYFIDNANNLVGKPILDIANSCETSKSAVVRLCKRLGFNGYKDFQNALSAEIAVKKRDNLYGHSDIYPKSSVSKICSIVTHNSIQAMESTLRLLDIEEMEKAVEVISKAKRLDFYGAGNSGICAEDAELKFSRIGYYTNCCTDVHRQLLAAATIKSGDVALFFSYYGTTKDILDVHDIVKEQGATTVAITCIGGNLLSKKADIVLETASTESLTRSGAMTSRLVMLGVLDMLFTAVASKNYRKVKDVLDKTAGIVRRERY